MPTYAEMTAMDGAELAKHGYRRNDKRGLTRLRPGERPPGSGRRSWGVLSLVKGLFGGAAPAEIAATRLAICQACQEKDRQGERLFRPGTAGKTYCGAPRLGKLRRDEAREGCGCELSFKASRAEASCPLGHWKALSDDDAPPLRLYDPAEPAPAVPPPQPSLEGAMSVGQAKPCGCGKTAVSK
jgi:hypothetical protein